MDKANENNSIPSSSLGNNSNTTQLSKGLTKELANNSTELANDCISRQAAIDAADSIINRDTSGNNDVVKAMTAWKEYIKALPSAQPEWNNHTVACLLAELFDDTCACNYNGIDEWLPNKCELLDACPNPVGVACWEQYLKHRAERREE